MATLFLGHSAMPIARVFTNRMRAFRHAADTDEAKTMRTKPPTPATALKPWQRRNPKTRGERTKLSAEDKEAARQRAASAGRRYPNLIDNMWAASRKKRSP